MKYYFIILVSICCFQHGFAQSLQPSTGFPSTIMVVAHRGAHVLYPENSIPSISEALGLGVDMVEIDVRHTRDSVLVLMHDETVDRTTDGYGYVADYTWSELSKLKLKNADGTLTPYPIPRLEEVLLKFKKNILFDLDVKTPHFTAVVELVDATESSRACFFLLDDEEKALFLRQRSGHYNILFAPKDGAYIASVMEILKPEIIHLNDKMNTPEINAMVKSFGGRTFINSLWGVDKFVNADPDAFRRVYQYGASMVQTDYPDILLKHLRTNSLHR